MKQYRVKITFTDSEGEHEKGSRISLSDERASKLLGLGKVVQMVEKVIAVKVDASGLEEITSALEDAAGVIEALRDELEVVKEAGARTAYTLQATLDASTEAYRSLVVSLQSAKYIGKFEEIVSTLPTGLVENTEEIDG